MFSGFPDFSKVFYVLLFLAALGVILGLWKLIDLLAWCWKHINISIT